MSGYLDSMGWFDRLIIGLGFLTVLVQLIFYIMYVLKIKGFDKNANEWFDWLVLFFDLFPLMGLLGTVNGMLDTFKEFKENMDITSMMAKFAPALTSTVSGIIALILNLIVFIFIKRIISVINEGEEKR